jgi:hypothetical protein
VLSVLPVVRREGRRPASLYIKYSHPSTSSRVHNPDSHSDVHHAYSDMLSLNINIV